MPYRLPLRPVYDDLLVKGPDRHRLPGPAAGDRAAVRPGRNEGIPRDDPALDPLPGRRPPKIHGNQDLLLGTLESLGCLLVSVLQRPEPLAQVAP